MFIKEMYWSALNYFSTTRVWRFFARNILAHLGFRVWGYPTFPMHKYYEIEKTMLDDPNAMYAFVGVDKMSLSWIMNNLVTKCQWSHAGMVRFGTNHGEPHLLQFVGKGFDPSTSLLDYLRTLDHFALLKIEFPNAIAKQLAEKRLELLMLNQDTLEYDFNLKLDLESDLAWLDAKGPVPNGKIKFYCSEFVYAIANGLTSNPNFKAAPAAGRLAFEPDDLYRATTVVFEA